MNKLFTKEQALRFAEFKIKQMIEESESDREIEILEEVYEDIDISDFDDFESDDILLDETNVARFEVEDVESVIIALMINLDSCSLAYCN